MLPLADAVQIREFSGYFVGWWTLSFINAGLAQSKNRNGLFWWLVSVPLGPVATFLIVALLDKNYVGRVD
ncbi:MAG TPA: hypothetical protein VHD36_17525 [Pirellulales bacterium]|nr:hypothetical protein [Pirellulales bacterium]